MNKTYIKNIQESKFPPLEKFKFPIIDFFPYWISSVITRSIIIWTLIYFIFKMILNSITYDTFLDISEMAFFISWFWIGIVYLTTMIRLDYPIGALEVEDITPYPIFNHIITIVRKLLSFSINTVRILINHLAIPISILFLHQSMPFINNPIATNINIFVVIMPVFLSHQTLKIKTYLSIYELTEQSTLYKNISSLLPLTLSIGAFIISILSIFLKN